MAGPAQAETLNIPHALPVIDRIYLPTEWNIPRTEGKVRDIFKIRDGKLAIVSTDRLSAFDKVLTHIPYRGQLLNEISEWWFDNTRDIIPNHKIDVPDPNVMIVREYPRIDLEIIVRGYLTGVTSTSIWKRYQNGEREFGDVILPDGMHKNMKLPHPILDPTTKALVGHDEKATKAEILASGIVTPREWEEIETAALAVFARGQELSDKANLKLVDTKYEVARDPQTRRIVFIDELHTPDSSRYWKRDTYEERVEKGKEPENYDKEFGRLFYENLGYKGDGEPPVMPEAIQLELMNRYMYVYEQLTGRRFVFHTGDPQKRIVANMERWFERNRYI